MDVPVLVGVVLEGSAVTCKDGLALKIRVSVKPMALLTLVKLDALVDVLLPVVV